MAVIDVEPIRERFFTVASFLNERDRRLVAAFAAGYGGIAAVAIATGMAPSTIGRGLKELAQDELSGRVRRPRAGRKPAIVKDPTLVADLEALVEPTTWGVRNRRCGGPARACAGWPRRCSGRAIRRVAPPGGRTAQCDGYSLQGNRKTKEGDSHPDRDAQFAHINTQVATASAEQQPVISVDTKKEELVGDFRNNGREYRPQGCPEEVRCMTS